MSSTAVRPAQQQKGRRRRQRRPAQNKAGRKTVKQMAVGGARRQGKRRNRARRNGMRGNLTARTPSGLGATSFKNTKARSITVSNDEFVGAVTVANQPAFNVVSYAINPGQSTLFPWLSRQATQWEKYVFQKLEFYYKREVSEFATAGAAGKVIFSVDFDASDAPPTTKQQMEDSVPHADSMPSENLSLILPVSQMHGPSVISKYVRTGGLPGNADIKTYDVGNLHVATQGIPSNTEVGELRVRYTCIFSVPVLDSTNAAPANNQVTQYQSQTDVLTTATPHTLVWGTVDANGLSAVNTAGSIVLPAGNYIVWTTVNFEASGANLTDVNIIIQKNSVAVKTNPPQWTPSAGTTVISYSDQTYFSSNGTDTLKVVVSQTFGAGTAQAYATLTILAV